MKKFLLVTIGIVAGITVLANLGAIIGLVISAAIMYAGWHFYHRTASGFGRFCWAAVGIIGALTAIGNIPAFVGLLAVAALWYVYHKWNNREAAIPGTSDDPFDNFEREWSKLTK
ncbi:lmo0954 family membrane protein [Edaphobacillus lindanitolerans]|uniref:Lia operon protein LiaI n=1 Tax=Edaphobacillus lindanitolerans TaxID=550447 RepID=A0A1U7PNJ7_9BACI|nr:ABC transporter permease [Edaphobacillus lindanitolerans]SIT74949.1 lia operon protein LiaI [Edaphobacillus lindanitolerans]